MVREEWERDPTAVVLADAAPIPVALDSKHQGSDLIIAAGLNAAKSTTGGVIVVSESKTVIKCKTVIREASVRPPAAAVAAGPIIECHDRPINCMRAGPGEVGCRGRTGKRRCQHSDSEQKLLHT